MMNKFRFLFSSVVLFFLCCPVTSKAQLVMDAADSIAFNTQIYSELYNAYKIRMSDLNKGVIDAVSKVLVEIPFGEMETRTKLSLLSYQK